jgi:hypothetical protein
MKMLTRTLSLVVITSLGFYCVGCGGETTEPDLVEKVQLAKLSSTWNVSSVTLDNNSRISDFTNFKLTLAGTFKDSSPKGPYQYSVSGSRPSNNPWPPAGGNWSFGADTSKDIVRHDNPDLSMSYTVTDTQLTLTFNYTGNGFIGGRTAQVSGNWVFTFTKP